jgi:5-methylcytosine-specific restriction endonuclease McrA
VLNRLWQPVHTCTARRAIALLYLGHAQVVHTDAGEDFFTHDFASWAEFSAREAGRDVVRTVRQVLRVPKIIVLAIFDRLPKKDVKFTRENVFRRDHYTCQYCGERFDVKKLNLDHVIPRDKGGATSWENVVCSCIRCNTRKGNKLPREAKMYPLREPRMPRWRPLFSSPAESGGHESWRHFTELPETRVQVSA